MVTYDSFKTKISEFVRDYYKEENVKVSIEKIKKNNGLNLDGLIIMSNATNICPTIYINQLYDDYKKGRAITDIQRTIIQVYESNKIDTIELSEFCQWNTVKQNIRMKVINKDMNQGLLEDCPHFYFLDLCVIFYATIPAFPDGSVTIHNNHLLLWNISEDELLKIAKENNEKEQYEITDMMSVMTQILVSGTENNAKEVDSHVIEPCSTIYVLTNQKKLFGSSVILEKGYLRRMGEIFNSNFYILPSSIHEVIAVASTSKDMVKTLRAMVHEVNTTIVSVEERLSDSVYLFNRNTELLTIA